MSDTPRTDLAQIEGYPFSYVDADFSRYLERELVAARAELAEAQAEIVRLKGEAESWEKVFDRTCELLADAKTALAEAVAKEREWCAGVCEEIVHPDESAKIEEKANWYAGTWACAAAIKRGE
tara:strand:- start:125 stop:493 length:369 start_codon:yes stop_codon:yes gene_type:complete